MGKGDKRMPLPDAAMLERAQTAGVASGVLVGDSALIVAVVPVGGARRGDSTYLVLAMPVEAPGSSEGDGRAGHDVRRAAAGFGGGQRRASRRRCRGWSARKARGARTIRRRRGSPLAAPVSARSCGSGCCIRRQPPAASPDACPRCSAVVAILLGVAAFVASPRAGRRRAARPPATGGSGLPVDEVPELATHDCGARAARDEAVREAERAGPPADRDRQERHAPAGSALPAWNAGIAGRAAELRRESYPERRARRDRARAPSAATACCERLGEGGMAELYTAVLHGAEGFRRVYVVKRLRPEVARNRAAVEQFIDEAKLGSTLVHSNIVPVFDFGKVGDEYFLAQEYIIGRDLGKVLQRHLETARASAEREVRALRRARGAGGARLRAQPDRRARASRSASCTATSRPATSWSRRAAR